MKVKDREASSGIVLVDGWQVNGYVAVLRDWEDGGVEAPGLQGRFCAGSRGGLRIFAVEGGGRLRGTADGNIRVRLVQCQK